MRISIIFLYVLVLPLFFYGQSFNISIGAGQNMNFSQFYNTYLGQNLLLSTFSPVYGGSISYTNKKRRKIQGNVYYNKALNAVKVPEGGPIPFGINFKMTVPFCYMQYGLSYHIPLYVGKQDKISLYFHPDAGINVLTWNSYAKGVWDTLVYQKNGNNELWLNYSSYTMHQYDYNIFLGGGLNLDYHLSDNISVQMDIAYKSGVKPLSIMKLEYIAHQISPQDNGIYSAGFGFSSCNSLTSRLSLIYHLHTHRREKK
jgi:hypothetical protein